LDKFKKNSDDPEMEKHLNRMNAKTKSILNSDHYDVRVFCKSRVINPLVRYKSKMHRVSEIEKSWQKILKQESKPKVYFIKFMD